jgi:MoaD family protein
MSPQITIHVNFYGVLREITGKKSDEIQLESDSLGDLLGALAGRYRGPFASFFLRSKDLSPQVNIFVNHVVVPSERIPEIKLRHGDQIDLFVPVSGG